MWTDSDVPSTEAGESYFGRIASSGELIGIVSHLGGRWCTSLARTGAGFAVTCQDVFLLLSPDGSESASIPAEMQLAAVAWDGEQFGIAWPDYRDGNYEIYFLARSPDGAALGTDLRVTHTPDGSGGPSMVALAGTFAVSWEDVVASGHEVFFARFGCP